MVGGRTRLGIRREEEFEGRRKGEGLRKIKMNEGKAEKYVIETEKGWEGRKRERVCVCVRGREREREREREIEREREREKYFYKFDR